MKKNIILMIVAIAMFMEAVDTTVLNTAIPAMAHSLQVNPISLKLALISYLLSLAIFTPISGWVADKYGVKRVFIFAIGIFTLSSIWCGFTNNLIQLICGRILQGIGGSLTLPVGRLIIVRTCERNELVSKMSIVVMIAAMGMMLGPVVGGIITNHFSWHWIFWINAPIGLIAMILAAFLLPSMPAQAVYQLDKIGFFLFGTGLAFLTLGLSILSESKIGLIDSGILIGMAVLLLSLYIWHSRTKIHPIVKIELLRVRTFKVSVLGNLLSRMGFGGIPFVLPLMFQLVLGFSPQTAGFLLAPIALGVLMVKPLSLRLLRLFGYKNLLLINTFLMTLSLCSFMLINQYSSHGLISLLTFCYGFIISLQYTGMNSLAYGNLQQEDISSATSIMSTIQQLGQSFGVAVAAIIISLFSGAYAGHQSFTIKIFHQTFFALALLTLCSLFLFMHLKKDDGKELIYTADV
ncbi:MAG: MFS transporter [Legionella sp.]|jgi:EmrB/QacA subfamily drug resistance transporter